MTLIVALPRESRPGERRVALDPKAAAQVLLLPDVELHIQADCGTSAGFDDASYGDVVVHERFDELVHAADVVVKVAAPTVAEAVELPEESVLIAHMNAFDHFARDHLYALQSLCQRRVTTLAMDLVPRITRAQSMDVLSSQATVAGYKAALLAAQLTPRLFPMLTTAAGTLMPARVVVIGAGVAGLQAIATARRIGADVEAYDIRRAAKEQIESLGARMIDTGVEAEGAGGYARALTQDERQTQHDVLATHLAEADAVICTAAIPGRRAPRIITADMVTGMRPGSVIVDAAADTGGNCEFTRAGTTHIVAGVTLSGPMDLASSGAVDASEMFGHNCLHMLRHLLPAGRLTLDWDDRILQGCRLTCDGAIWHEPTARLMGVVASQAQAEKEARENADASDESIQDEPSTDDPATGWLIEEEPESIAPEHEVPVARPDKADKVIVDDLTRIHNIGPAMQIKLNAFGIRRFRDLAVLDAVAVTQLEQQLEIENRILREDWPGQARRLERAR